MAKTNSAISVFSSFILSLFIWFIHCQIFWGIFLIGVLVLGKFNV